MKLVRYGREGALTNYLPLPRPLLELDLSGTALLLYALLLDRATLSRKNGWWSEEGWVYVRYPVKKLASALGRGSAVVKVRLRELEQAGLIRRVTPRRGEASQIFLSLPEDAFSAGGGPKSRPAPGRKTSRDPAKKPAPNDLREQRNLNDHSYVYGEGESL